MTKDRPPQPDPPAPDPSLPSLDVNETTAFGSPSVGPAPEHAPGKKKIDPWRFGMHTVPPGMQAQLLAEPLPATPKDRIYRSPGPLRDSGESAAPLATDDVQLPKRDRRGVVVFAGLAVLLIGVVVQRFVSGGESIEPPQAADQDSKTEAARTKASAAQIDTAPSIKEPPAEPPAAAVSADRKPEKPAKEPRERALPKAPTPTPPATPPAPVKPNVSNPPAPAGSAKRRPGFDPDRPLWGND